MADYSKPVAMNILAENDAAYIAGFVDGEGSICFHRNHKNDSKTTTYSPRLRITNTNKDVLDWIAVVIGLGKVRSQKLYANNTKPVYEWYASGRYSIAVLKQLIPFLKVKKLQAETCVSYGLTLQKSGRLRLAQEVIDEREILRNNVVSLNRTSAMG
uniref:Putative homing endonuclease n=1 Tax=viral metagenome TaxID=1070528 RepID=A0A6M3J686_9ZZZZ